MRVTAPTLRRRNHAWLQMRSLERRAIGVARRQQQDDTSSDDADTSGNESDNSVDSSDDEADVKPTQTIRTPVVSATVAVRAGKLAALPTARAETAVGVTLSAEEPGKVELDSDSDGIDSDSDESGDETTAPPGTPTPPPAANPPPPQPTVTEPASTSAIRAPPPPASSTVHPDHHKSKLQPPSQPEETSTRFSTSTIVPLPVTSAKSSSSIDDILTSIAGIAPTQLTTLSLASVASTSTGASPTLPATGSAQTGASEVADPQANEREGEGLGVVSTPQKKLSSGAVAGIVVGVLAAVAILAIAILFWRRRRRAEGLPFSPFTRDKEAIDDSYAPDIAAPLPGQVGGPALNKTNTQIMDDLMKAAYMADGGMNDMEGAYGGGAEKLPPQLPPQQQVSAFMDERAYAALAGPITPSTPKPPVMQWLTEVKTPTQPNGPEMPPTPEMPPSATMPRLTTGGRLPEPPQPAYYGRDTMTTDTTNTSVRWYG